MTLVKIRRDGHSAVITIPADTLREAGLEIGAHASITVDPETGEIRVNPVRVVPRASGDFLTAARHVADENCEVLGKLATR